MNVIYSSRVSIILMSNLKKKTKKNEDVKQIKLNSRIKIPNSDNSLINRIFTE